MHQAQVRQLDYIITFFKTKTALFWSHDKYLYNGLVIKLSRMKLSVSISNLFADLVLYKHNFYRC